MKKALIGAGGHAREVMAQMGEILPCFVDDKYVNKDTLPLSTFNPNEYQVLIAIGNSYNRSYVVNSLPKQTKYFTFIHPTAQIIGNDVKIGKGSFIGANSILTTNITTGDHVLLNRGNHIGHDCEIGDYLSMMPGSIISGNVKIGDKVYIGTNSSIKEKLQLCSNITIGMSSGVLKSIKTKGTYVGTPCKKIKK